jgi:hypothetical protein
VNPLVEPDRSLINMGEIKYCWDGGSDSFGSGELCTVTLGGHGFEGTLGCDAVRCPIYDDFKVVCIPQCAP